MAKKKEVKVEEKAADTTEFNREKALDIAETLNDVLGLEGDDEIVIDDEISDDDLTKGIAKAASLIGMNPKTNSFSENLMKRDKDDLGEEVWDYLTTNKMLGHIPEKKETPKKETPKKETPKKETPKKETPKKDVPKKDVPKKDVPKKDVPKKDVPKKDNSEALEKARLAKKAKEDAKKAKESKFTRSMALVEALKKGGTAEEIIKNLDDLYVKNGGKSNLNVAEYKYSMPVLLLLGVVKKEGNKYSLVK